MTAVFTISRGRLLARPSDCASCVIKFTLFVLCNCNVLVGSRLVNILTLIRNATRFSDPREEIVPNELSPTRARRFLIVLSLVSCNGQSLRAYQICRAAYFISTLRNTFSETSVFFIATKKNS